MIMEIASQMMLIMLYLFLSILVIVTIVFIYKLTMTLDKANTLLDDVYGKVRKLDNLFDVIDKSADTINMVTNKVSDGILNFVFRIFKRRRKDEDYE